MSSIQELREQAARCRRLAASIDDSRAQKGLLELAERYEAEAEELEPPEPPSES